MAVLLGSACLAAAGCSKKSTETEKATEKVTEAAVTEAAEKETAEAAEKETAEAATEAAVTETAEAGVETEAPAKTESAEETEADTEASEADTETAEADTEAAEDTTEGTSEDVSEEAKEVTEEELAQRPEYTALDYVTLGTYKDLAVTVDPIEVTEEEIDASVEGAITGKDMYDEQTEGTVADGDLVNIDYEGKKDGVAFNGGTAQGYDLEIGSGSFIDGFEAGLIGVKVGDTVDLNLTFPENYGSAELAGQAVVFTVTVNAIKTMPEVTDELVSKLSDGAYSTVDGYREYMRETLQANKEEQQKNEILNDLMTQIYNTCTVNEYPQELVDYSVASMKKVYEGYAQMYGLEFADFITNYFGMTEEEFAAESEKAVKSSLQQELILKAIAEQEGLTISEEEYEQGCVDYAETYGYESADHLKENFDEGTIRISLIMDKVLDFLRDNAVITEAVETETASEAATEADTEAVVTEAAEADTEAAVTEADTEAAVMEAAEDATEADTEAAETESASDAE